MTKELTYARRALSGISASLITANLFLVFYKGGGGATYSLFSMSKSAVKLKAQLRDRVSPFSISSNMAKQNTVISKIFACVVALFIVAAFVAFGLELQNTSDTAWDLVHIYTLGLLFLLAVCVATFSITNMVSVGQRPHLIATSFTLLSIPLFFVFAASELEDNRGVPLYTVASFMVVTLFVMVYSYYSSKMIISNSNQNDNSSVDKIAWAHIRNGAVVAATEASYFTQAAIGLVILSLSNFAKLEA